MIVDHISCSELYSALGERFARGFAYLRDFDPETPLGRYELDGDRLYALVQEYQTTPTSDKQLEAHQKYADIQYVVKGSESIVYAPLHSAEMSSEYNAEKDVAFYPDRDGMTIFRLQQGHFSVFFPKDGHKPGCHWGGSATVLKVVLKALLEE